VVMCGDELPVGYSRHRRLAGARCSRRRGRALPLAAAEGCRAATVTSALPMPGLEGSAYRRLLREKYGVVIAGGQGKMTGMLIRVGHLGAVSDGDVVQVLWAMERALEDLDMAPTDGRSMAAAAAFLAEEA